MKKKTIKIIVVFLLLLITFKVFCYADLILPGSGINRNVNNTNPEENKSDKPVSTQIRNMGIILFVLVIVVIIILIMMLVISKRIDGINKKLDNENIEIIDDESKIE